MSVTLLLVLVAIMLVLIMTGAWRTVIATGNSGWVDTIWSFAIGLAGVWVALAPLPGVASSGMRQGIVALLVAVWSIRLGSHILTRTLKGKDDPRYAQLRKEWGEGNYRSRLFLFLQIQALAAFILAVSVLAASRNPSPDLRLADWLGIAILVVAIAGEAIADRQLKAFAADPANKGKVCDVGLWGVSRHPNYFFEWLGWVAYLVIAVDFSGAYHWGWAAVLGPVLMYWLLAHVSGVPPLEAHMLRSRGDAFRAYQKRVNAFWPGPQKSA